MNFYVPIFSKIVDSSLWTEPDFVVKVFITMLAKKDKDNVCRGSAFNIAKWACKPESEVLEALKVLSSPDTKRIEPQAFDGRRIEKVEDGWVILNGPIYQQMMKDANRRAYKTEKQREYRGAEPGDIVEDSPPVQKPVRNPSSNPEHEPFIKGWCDNFEAFMGFKYHFGGRDAKAVSQILKLGILRIDLLEIAKKAWARAKSDQFASNCKKASTIHGFKEFLNQIQVELKNETNVRNNTSINGKTVITPVKGSAPVGGF